MVWEQQGITNIDEQFLLDIDNILCIVFQMIELKDDAPLNDVINFGSTAINQDQSVWK